MLRKNAKCKELNTEIALFSFVYVKVRRKFILKQMAYGSIEYSGRSWKTADLLFFILNGNSILKMYMLQGNLCRTFFFVHWRIYKTPGQLPPRTIATQDNC